LSDKLAKHRLEAAHKPGLEPVLFFNRLRAGMGRK
jgi:hypothetical protein